MGKLTDKQIRAWIKAGERFEGRSDGNGLYLPTTATRGRISCAGSFRAASRTPATTAAAPATTARRWPICSP
ncbi:hypothetical protein FSD44_14600 [Salmonella enterica]|nr:hypothetical protein [Salmonella enterica]